VIYFTTPIVLMVQYGDRRLYPDVIKAVKLRCQTCVKSWM